MDIVYHPSAAEELIAAARFYESRQEGLGEKFLDAIEDALRRVCDYPLRWKANGQGNRQYVVKRFPYLLMYRVEASRIFILAVAHTSRKPGYWTSREL